MKPLSQQIMTHAVKLPEGIPLAARELLLMAPNHPGLAQTVSRVNCRLRGAPLQVRRHPHLPAILRASSRSWGGAKRRCAKAFRTLARAHR